MAILSIKPAGRERLRRKLGHDKRIAQAFGVSPATACRVLSGQTEPSAKFVAGAISALGKPWFGILFAVVDEKAS